MARCFQSGLALAFLLLGPAAVLAQPHPHAIVAISVCIPNGGSGPSGSCPNGGRDSAQFVAAPSGDPLNSYGGLGVLADEHSTVLPPGALPGHPDYLFFVATTTNLNSGMAVLSGGAGPDATGRWTLDFAPDFGLYDPSGPAGSQNGPIFRSAMEHLACPSVPTAAQQDPTFDLNYSDGGTVVIDPTNRANEGPGSFLMIYEGTNRCIGKTGGAKVSNNFYSSIGIATSADQGHTWPTYRATQGFDFYPLPDQNPSAGPNAPLGAFGNSVCMGNDCATTPPENYGRYAVLTPPVTVAHAIAETTGGLSDNMGDAEPSAFVDDVGGPDDGNSDENGDSDADRGPERYLYVVHGYSPGPFPADPPISPTVDLNSDLMIARARLNGGSAPLEFTKWFDGSFAELGLGSDGGGRESPIFPVIDSSLYANCLAPDQSRHMGSISYVDETQQYLLTFVCSSPSDPDTAGIDPGGDQTGAAWFYSTIDATQYDLSHVEQWSLPQEIIGSWNTFAGGGCRNFTGWYPSFMSLHRKPGHLSTEGYVFYMSGCTGGDTPGGRQFSSRLFTITTNENTTEEEPASPLTITQTGE